MKNIQGNQKELKLYNEKGIRVYEFYKFDVGEGFSEYTFDENGKALTFKNSNKYFSKWTRDKDGKELTYEDSDGEKRGFN
tara:strand:+ start:159 stop:398 length:240 start_codon:yes stop_codon:yes gene_type:complete